MGNHASAVCSVGGVYILVGPDRIKTQTEAPAKELITTDIWYVPLVFTVQVSFIHIISMYSSTRYTTKILPPPNREWYGQQYRFKLPHIS